jgi:hypothetical protein
VGRNTAAAAAQRGCCGGACGTENRRGMGGHIGAGDGGSEYQRCYGWALLTQR